VCGHVASLLSVRYRTHTAMGYLEMPRYHTYFISWPNLFAIHSLIYSHLDRDSRRHLR
jgi:hypothetical protein